MENIMKASLNGCVLSVQMRFVKKISKTFHLLILMTNHSKRLIKLMQKLGSTLEIKFSLP